MAFFPTSRSEAESWLNNFVQSQDGLDATQTSKIYCPDAILRFANFPILKSARNIEEAVSARFVKLDKIRHVPRYFDLVGTGLWAAFDVTYRVKGDPAMENLLVPCVCVFTIACGGAEQGKISELEIYMDQTSVGERIDKAAQQHAALNMST